LKLKIIDKIISEVPGGAHRFADQQFKIVKNNIIVKLDELKKKPIEILVKERNEKFLSLTAN